MADQTAIKSFPGDLSPDQAPATAAVHPPRDSYGPGSADESAGAGDGDTAGTERASIGGPSRDGS